MLSFQRRLPAAGARKHKNLRTRRKFPSCALFLHLKLGYFQANHGANAPATTPACPRATRAHRPTRCVAPGLRPLRSCPHIGLADQHRVVLDAALKHLNGTAKFAASVRPPGTEQQSLWPVRPGDDRLRDANRPVCNQCWRIGSQHPEIYTLRC